MNCLIFLYKLKVKTDYIKAIIVSLYIFFCSMPIFTILYFKNIKKVAMQK